MVELRRLKQCRRGSIAVEVALISTLLILLTFGMVEIARFAYLRQSLDIVANDLGDYITAEAVLDEGKVNDFMAAATAAASPLDLTTGRILITSVHNPSGDGAEVAWQRSSGIMVESESLTAAGLDSLPGNLTIRPDDNIIIVELFAPFEPIFAGALMDAMTLQARSFYHPRIAPLDELAAE